MRFRRSKKILALVPAGTLSLAELYVKQHRFYEAKEILNVLDSFCSINETEMQKGMLDRQTIMKLLNTCSEKATKWEEKQAKSELLLHKSQSSYGSHLETGSFYFKVGELERAEQAYLKAIARARSLIMEHQSDQTIDLHSDSSLLGAYFGLAQTYLALERRMDAIAALDDGSQHIEKLYTWDLPEVLEGFSSLFVDLYLRLGEREKAISICQHVLAIMPNSITLKEKMRLLTEKDTDNLLEARV